MTGALHTNVTGSGIRTGSCFPESFSSVLPGSMDEQRTKQNSLPSPSRGLPGHCPAHGTLTEPHPATGGNCVVSRGFYKYPAAQPDNHGSGQCAPWVQQGAAQSLLTGTKNSVYQKCVCGHDIKSSKAQTHSRSLQYLQSSSSVEILDP